MVGRVLMTRRSHKLKLRSRRLNGRRKGGGGCLLQTYTDIRVKYLGELKRMRCLFFWLLDRVILLFELFREDRTGNENCWSVSKRNFQCTQ